MTAYLPQRAIRLKRIASLCSAGARTGQGRISAEGLALRRPVWCGPEISRNRRAAGCTEFDKFEPLFDQCIREEAEGKRKATLYNIDRAKP
jgi:hypothetical protein